MDILLITPAPPGSKAGNRATAERWALLLGELGHSVEVITEYAGQRCDLFIALHAWRSHEAVAEFRKANPVAPLIVVLTGTDIYDHQYRFPEETRQSMEAADCLIGLHHRVKDDIPPTLSVKLVTVLQSAEQPQRRMDQASDRFDVCVVGHLREEKDSLRAALAARHLPEESRIHVINIGKPHSDAWAEAALDEQRDNARFEWRGEIDKPATQALMQQCRLMVISSIMEGGANVVSEACRLGLPILASDISGNIGLLGDDYPGYFRAGDEQDLARLMMRAESSEAFMRDLTERVSRLARCFTPESEKAALAEALKKAGASAAG